MYICLYVYMRAHYTCKDVYVNVYMNTHILSAWSSSLHEYVHMCIQPIVDRVAQNLEIISKNFRFSIRGTRILMGFVMSTIHYVVLIVTPMGRFLVRSKKKIETILRSVATLFAISCVYICVHITCAKTCM